jgi:hypothetical protein
MSKVYVKCSACGNHVPQVDFDAGEHSCVKASSAGDREARLKRLLASGGCNQKYFDDEMRKLAIEVECNKPVPFGC